MNIFPAFSHSPFFKSAMFRDVSEYCKKSDEYVNSKLRLLNFF